MDLDLLCLMFLFLRGLLNCLCRVVGRLEHALGATFSQLYLSTFRLNAPVGIFLFSKWPFVNVSVFFLSASTSINYTQLHFIFLIAGGCVLWPIIDFSYQCRNFLFGMGCFDRRVRRGKAILYREQGTPVVLFV